MKSKLFNFLAIVAITCIFTVPSARNIDVVQAQNYSNQEVNRERAKIEKELFNTTWAGTYKLNPYVFDTTLTIKSVSSGYIGAEISHKETSQGRQGLLRVKVAGDIIVQYLIDLKKNGSFIWIDEDGISPEQLAESQSESLIRNKRQLIRLKRFRGLEYRNIAGSRGWSTNREYRLLLQNNELKGAVGIPLEAYGNGDVIREDGTLLLRRK